MFSGVLQQLVKKKNWKTLQEKEALVRKRLIHSQIVCMISAFSLNVCNELATPCKMFLMESRLTAKCF